MVAAEATKQTAAKVAIIVDMFVESVLKLPFDSVLHFSFKDVCHPNDLDFKRSFFGSLRPYLRQLAEYCSAVRGQPSLRHLMRTSDAVGGTKPKLGFERAIYDLLYAVKAFCQHHTPSLAPIVFCTLTLTETPVPEEAYTFVPSRSAVIQCASALGAHSYACAPLDKNASTGTLSCPYLWWKLYRDEV